MKVSTCFLIIREYILSQITCVQTQLRYIPRISLRNVKKTVLLYALLNEDENLAVISFSY